MSQSVSSEGAKEQPKNIGRVSAKELVKLSSSSITLTTTITDLIKEALAIPEKKELDDPRIPDRVKACAVAGLVAKVTSAAVLSWAASDVISAVKFPEYYQSFMDSASKGCNVAISIFSIGVILYNSYFKNAARYYQRRSQHSSE